MSTFNATSAYIALSLISIVAIILLSLLIHLIIVTKRRASQKGSRSLISFNRGSRRATCSLFITMFGILYFEISILLIIGVIVVLILIDGNHIDHEFSESFAEMEYLIAIFDALGHITMLYLFVDRLQYCFKDALSTNSNPKRLFTILYSILILLVIASFCIVILIILGQSPMIIFSFELAWESIVELMCLYLLYLFMAELYHLFTLSFSRRNLMQNVTQSLHANYQHRKAEQTKPHKARNSTELQRPSVELVMTIDGVPMQPPRMARKVPSKSNMNEHHEVSRASGVVVLDGKLQKTSRRGKYAQTAQQIRHANQMRHDDLVGMMNKMTLLVLCVVLSSLISIVANSYLEIREMNTIHRGTADIGVIWAFLFLALDMLATALMLYLQFAYMHGVYLRLCGKLDLLLMGCTLKIARYLWRKQQMQEQSESATTEQENLQNLEMVFRSECADGNDANVKDVRHSEEKGDP